jgi:5'-3' exonuclease
MGIKDINETIKKYYSYSQARLDCLKGRCIAVDFGTWMFKYWMPASKRVIMRTNLITSDPDPNEIRKTWFTYSQAGLLKILNSGIYPIFVFDGPSPVEKQGEKAKRIDAKMKSKNSYQQMLQDARSSHDILDSSMDLTTLRKECVKAYSIPHEEYDNAMYFLSSLGFNVFKPNCEAEKFCSMLCLDGHVSGVYSSDTDNLVYGCPLWISDIEDGMLGDDYCTYMTYMCYSDLLTNLSISPEVFTDLCILHGCDYNNRIKGIGPDKASKLIMQYGCLEAISQVKNVECLNYQRCRELFSYQPSKDLCDQEVIIKYMDVNPDVLEYYLSFYEANDHYMAIRDGIQYCKDQTMVLVNMI